jgi:hypothetical protein
MMGRWVASIVVLVSWAAGQPAMAGDRGPVCREPSVLDEMAREIRDQDYYGRVDPRLVTETPTAELNLVRCQVCVLAAPYNMTRFGDQPIPRCVAHDFEIRMVPGGFVVYDLR